MRKLLIISTLMVMQSSFAQEIRLGLCVGTGPTEFVSTELALHSPINSYYTYVESDLGEGLVRTVKVFNSVNIGAVLHFSYRRLAFTLEPQFFYKRGIYKFREPIEVKRIIGAKAFRMPFYFSYKFFKKENSGYVLAGFNVTNETVWDFQHPGDGYYLSSEPYFEQVPDFGDDHFEGVLYDERPYLSFMVGLGKQFKKFNMSLRYQKNLGGINDRLPLDTWRTDLTFSWLFLSSKDFTSKHYLYID